MTFDLSEAFDGEFAQLLFQSNILIQSQKGPGRNMDIVICLRRVIDRSRFFNSRVYRSCSPSMQMLTLQAREQCFRVISLALNRTQALSVAA